MTPPHSRTQDLPAAPVPAPVSLANPRAAASFYRPELDVVRFLAFLFVFLHHVLPRDPAAYAHLPPRAAALLVSVANAAGFGLQLFFVLSAYLICELLLREKARTGTVDIPRFYKRRLLRIWPLYFLGLAIGCLWAITHGTWHLQAPSLAAYALMVGNIYTSLTGWGLAGNPALPLWSISIEEQFYLLWPSIAQRCTERGIRRAAWLILALSNLSLVYLGLHHANLDRTVWTSSFAQFYMFGAGILLSVYLHGRLLPLPARSRWLLTLGAAAAWFLASFVFHIKSLNERASIHNLLPGYALVAFGCLALILALMGLPRVPRLAVYLGRLSYGLYVFHELGIRLSLLLAARLHLLNAPRLLAGPAILLLALGLTVGLAMLSFRYFEAPFQRLKDRAAIIHSTPPEPALP